MAASTTIELDPVLPEGSQELLFALDPTGNSVATASKDTPQDAPVYLSTFGLAEARELVLDTYQVCAAAQALAQTPEVAHDEDAALEHFARVGTLYSAKLLQHLARLQSQLDQVPEQDEDEETLITDKRTRLLEKQDHWTTVYQIFALAQVLYLPSMQDATSDEPALPVVGEQLLHFINTVDPQPSREDGLQLASMSAPYSEPMFWSYLPRCIIRGLFKAASTLTASMADHPLPFVRHASNLICVLLNRVPRPSMYSTSYEHLRATHTFRMDVQRAITELTDQYKDVGRWTPVNSWSGRSSRQGPQVASEEDRQDWLTRILILLRLLKGEEDMVLNSCDDWKEALAAWAMLVRPTMTRDDIPDTVKKIWQTLPLERELPGEEAQEAFILGQASSALAKCNDLSPWLSTHLGDLLDKIGALDSDADAFGLDEETVSSPSTQRDWYLLQWADQLQGDEGVWRILLHYLAFVASSKNDALADVAEARMKAVLRHVKCRDPTLPSASAARKVDTNIEKLANGDVESHEKHEDQSQETTVEDVLRVAYEYNFEDVAGELCKAASEKLITVRDYGRAVAFAVQAGDAQRIARITELLIDEYILHGAGEFARLVDAFPTRLLRPDALTNKSFFKSLAPVDTDGAMDQDQAAADEEFGIEATQLSLFQDRISFLARYRDLHAFFANEQKPEAAKSIIGLLRSGVVPNRFQAVLLLDALSLLEDESDVYFDQQDTFELMRYLELIDTRSKTDKELLKPLRTLLGQGNWDRVALALRLSLTKNLSRCFCMA